MSGCNPNAWWLLTAMQEHDLHIVPIVSTILLSFGWHFDMWDIIKTIKFSNSSKVCLQGKVQDDSKHNTLLTGVILASNHFHLKYFRSPKQLLCI